MVFRTAFPSKRPQLKRPQANRQKSSLERKNIFLGQKRSSGRAALTSELLEDRYLLAADTILFDPDGPATNETPFEFASVDFTQGNALVTNYDFLINNPGPANTGLVQFQATLGTFSDAGSNTVTPNGGLGSNYEVTMVAEARVFFDAGSFQLAANQTGTRGLEIYHDVVNANALAGTGYDDGTMILHSSIDQFVGAFQFFTTLPAVNLDQFATNTPADNQWPGVLTFRGGGFQQIIGTPDFIDGDYFYDPNTNLPLTNKSLAEFSAQGDLATPFTTVDPSMSFLGAAPNIGTLNGDGVVDGTDAAMFQGDANASFTYATSSIHGFKFEDMDKDGIYDPNGDATADPPRPADSPFNGIPIELWTDADGDGVLDLGTDVQVDINGDFVVDGMDTVYTGDTNGDGVVDANDDPTKAGQFWFEHVCSGNFIIRERIDLLPAPMNTEVVPSNTPITVEAGFNYVFEPGASGVTGVAAGAVSNRQVFYNNSSFDGNGAAVTAGVDDVLAVDSTKSAYVPTGATGPATFANYTNYTRGLNGIIVDVAGAAGSLTAADFAFFTGTGQDTTAWTPVSAASVTSTTVGADERAIISFADNTIEDAWLKVVVLANANTQLPLDDIHYWGNLAGDANGSGTVNVGDLIGTNGLIGSSPITPDTQQDVNRSGAINVGDLIAANSNIPASLVMIDDTHMDYVECDKGVYTPADCEVVLDELSIANFVYGSIHGFKFDDYEGDGIYDPAGWDKPMGGVDFELTGTDGMGNPVGPLTATTDASGQFWFTDLMPGTYTITEIDDVTDDIVPSTPTQSATVTIYSRQEYAWQAGAAMIPAGSYKVEIVDDNDANDYGGYDANLMWGNVILGSIHGFKFEDYNGDGTYQGFTDADGDGVNDFDLNPGVAGEQFDVPWAGFEFQLWHDVNGDGALDGGDTQVDVNGDTAIDAGDSVFTDADGQFWFTGLMPGHYLVVETEVYDADGDGADDDLNNQIVAKTPVVQSVFVASGQELVWQLGAANLPSGSLQDEHLHDPDGSGFDERLMFGNAVLGSVHGFKCEDFDADGVCSTIISGDMPHVVFVVDVSGSTGLSSGFDIDGDGVIDSILDVELAAVKELVLQLDAEFGADAEVSVVLFSDNATSLDMDPSAAGVQLFAPANTLATDIDTVLAGIVDGGLTDYTEGLDLAKANLDAWAPAVADANVVFLSDGEPGDAVADINASAASLATSAGNIRAIGVGSGVSLASLSLVDAADGSDDAIVFDMPSDLLDFFSGGGTTGGGGTAFAGIPFSIYDSTGANVTPGPDGYVLTDATGEFWFEGLMPGEYTVTERTDLYSTLYPNDEIMASSHTSHTLFIGSREEHVWRTNAAGLDTTDPSEYRVEVSPDDLLTFSNYVKGSIHGFKFHDVDLDGVYDPVVDEAFKGVVFDLVDANGNTYRQIDDDFSSGSFVVGAGNVGTYNGFTTTSTDPDGTPDPDDLWSLSGGQLVSGDLNADETSTLTTTVDGFGYVAFDWTVESELFGDGLTFTIDGVPQDLHPGGTPDLFASGSDGDSVWYQILGAGPHTLEWTFSKDSAGNDPIDQATIDNLVFYDSTDDAGEFWYTGLIPGEYTVVEYPDAFTSYAGEVMSTTHSNDPAFDDPTLGPAIVQTVTIESRQELVWAPGAAMLPGDFDGDGIVDDNDADGDGLPDVLREEVLTPELAFGNFIKGSIHGFKFEDYNADGQYTPAVDLDPYLVGFQSDTPWGGFEFELWTDNDGDGVIDLSGDDPATAGVDESLDDDLLVDTQFSDATGQYWFTGLMPGSYVVVETENFDFDGDGAYDTESGDEVMASTPLMSAVTVGSGRELVWNDGAAMLDPLTNPMPKQEENVGADLMFGNFVKGSIHGFKYEDYNGNGVFDIDNDVAFGGIPFNLYAVDASGTETLVATEVSAYDGKFWFTDLTPGEYRLAEDLSSLTWADEIMPSNSPDRSFFIGSRNELVYKDGEAMIPADSLKQEVNTSYAVGLVDSTYNDVLGGNDLMFGNSVKGSIHGFKCEDVDADGLCETTAHTVIVIDASLSARGDFGDGSIDDTPGDVNGDGFFDTILDAQLAAAIDLNNALASLLVANTSMTVTIIEMSDGSASVVGSDLAVGADTTMALQNVGFGGFVTGFDTNLEAALDLAIADIAGSDPNRTNVYVMSDGVINVGDTGAALADEAAALATWSDNVNVLGIGHDTLLTDLLIVDPTATAYFAAADAGAALVANATGPDFGLPEMPQSGVTFTLTGTTAMGAVGPISVTTGPDGEFWFEQLYPGLYTVTETLPNGQASSTGLTWTQFIGSGEEYAWAEGEATLMPGLHTEVVDSGLIFGNYTPITIDIFKFNDFNADGNSAGDSGMAGIEFKLFDSSGVEVATGSSNLVGGLSFGPLVPGTYTVQEIDYLGDAIIPTTDTSITVTLYSGESAFLEFGNTILGSFHGFKFHDLNADGVYDAFVDADLNVDSDGDGVGDSTDGFNDFDLDPNRPGEQYETPWAGATFEIYDAGGALVGTTTTGADGAINFDGLYPGVYTISEVDDPTDNIHSTAAGGNTITVTINSGEELVWTPGAANLQGHPAQHEVDRPDLVFGNWIEGSIHGCVFHDDGDGVYAASDDTIAGGILVEVYDSTGAFVASMTTPGSGPDFGLFWFEGLRPDTYDIRVPDLQGGAQVDPSDINFNAPNFAQLVVTSGAEYAHTTGGAGAIEPNQVEVVVPDESLVLGVNVVASSATVPGVDPNSTSDMPEFDFSRFREQIKDLGFVAQLSEHAFESFDRDESVREERLEDADEDDLFAMLAENALAIELT
jgi:protocatechuate 3,4-dioxygenase beta subunit